MKIGFTGSRTLELYQEKAIIKTLERLVPEMTYAITGACIGVDTFIAEWLAENSDVQQVIVWPPLRNLTTESLYALPRTVHIEMSVSDVPKGAHKLGYKLRNQQIVDLSDRLVAFWDGKSKGTKMTIDLAKSADILGEVVRI